MTSQENATKLMARLRHALADVERYDVWAEPKKGDPYRQIEIRVSDTKTGYDVLCTTRGIASDSDIEAVVADLVGQLKKGGD